jgi:hypothetical protein
VAVDSEQLRNHLRRFYDCSGKVVLYFGAAGGQLLDGSFGAKTIVVIDQERASLERHYGGAAGEAAVEVIASSS